MKKINLTASSPFFRPEQFETEMLGGKEIPVLKISKEVYLSESFMFSLYSRELDVMPYEKSDDERRYMCVADNFYIIVERGEKGFETSLHYFIANIKIVGDEIKATINPIDDKDLMDTLFDKFAENEVTGADCFNEKNMKRSKNFDSLECLRMIEATDFVRLSYNGNLRKLKANLGTEGKLRINYDYDYRHLDTGKSVCGEIEVGTLLYTRSSKVRNMLEIVKLQSYAHDFNGDFCAIVETVYSYPSDAEKIKTAYPDFYAKECASDATIEKQRILDKARELPYIREEYKLGDGIIHIPVETSTAEISIPMGDFHFSVGNTGYGHLTHRAKGRLRLNDRPILCSLVEVNRRFKLLYYKVSAFVKFGGNYYAELKFDRQSNFLDSLDADLLNLQDLEWDARSMDKTALACAGYLMFRDMITPVILDEDSLGSNIAKE